MSETSTYRNIIYRLLPGSRANARRLAGQASACRFVWNTILGQHNNAHEEAKPTGRNHRRFRSSRSAGSSPVSATKSRGFAHTPSASPGTCSSISRCVEGVFRGEAGHPRFKSRHGSTPSFTIPEAVTIRDDMINVPRVGRMRIRRKGGNPYPEGKPVKAVIRKIAGKWYVTVCHEVEAEERPDTGVSAGVDMNVRQVAVVDTTGEAEDHPRARHGPA